MRDHQENRQYIESLATSNVVIHNAMRMTKLHDLSYEQCLELMVIQMAGIIEQQQKDMVEMVIRSPVQMITRPIPRSGL